MPKFRKKPVVIEAIRWSGDNRKEILDLSDGTFWSSGKPDKISIHTLEGVMTANIGDWIIKGANDETYPCQPDIFEKTYESVEEAS